MFGVGFSELFILALILFILLGPKELPQVMRGLAKIVREISKLQTEFKKHLEEDEDLRNVRDSVQEIQKTVRGHVDDLRSGIEKHVEEITSEVRIDQKSAPLNKEKESQTSAAPPST